ncbi:hypothetical protein [Streptomyces sp. NPDC005969]|uniref:hypothetical protein n=1 Tax=Streptomyces sp. NPDC005969 TaxID=3156722 RepID=UPI0033C498AE
MSTANRATRRKSELDGRLSVLVAVCEELAHREAVPYALDQAVAGPTHREVARIVRWIRPERVHLTPSQ